MEKTNLILELTFRFSISAIKYCELLQSRKQFLISNQLFRSATSIGANVSESQGAESRLDFIHKMKIAYKEAIETNYWLSLCNSLENYPSCTELLEQLQSIIKVIGKIITTAKHK